MRRRWFCCLWLLFGLAVFPALAQEKAPAPMAPAAGTAPAETSPSLDQLELQVKKDFDRFEKSLFNVAEGLRKNEPDRAELLYRARSQSETQRLADEMAAIADLLEKKARKPGDEASALYGRAGERQEELIARLEGLLKVLQSENERERIAKEIARVQDLLKDTSKIIGKQKDVRADTERAARPGERLQGDQEGVEKDARKLAEKIDRQDAERKGEQGKPGSPKESGKPSGKPESPKPDDQSKPGEKPGEKGTDPKEGKDPMKGAEPMKPEDAGKSPEKMPPGGPSQGKPQPGKPSSGKPSDQKPQQGKPSEGQQSQSPMGEPQGEQKQNPQAERSEKPESETPGRKELEEARREMEQAIQELKKKSLDNASKEQDEAIAQLEQMKAKLEEILRQLRQEEKDLYLTMLEARLQKMLRAQLRINTETTRLDKVDKATRGSQTAALSKDEGANALDADKTLNLLKEEGSSVAFPEAVEQMRDNMRLVTGRLEKSDTGETTQLIEMMIVEGLEEMLLAVQQEMEKARQQKNQQQKGQQGQPQDKELVAKLQELKMIRSLQNQVNRLTRQIGIQVDGEQATEPETIKLTEDLARRQRRIQQATYDLSTGKNK